MKLKLIALAAMLAAGSAHAAIDTGLLSGNGELMLNLKWKDTNTTDGNQSVSAAFDLGITMNDAVANFNTAGYSQSWDLSSYGSVFSTFTSAAVMANAEMNVIAFDGTGTNPGDTRIATTTSFVNSTTGALVLPSAGATPNNGVFNNVFGGTTLNNFLIAVNNSASHDSAANGASNADATSGFAWFDNGTGLDKLGQTAFFDTTNKFDGSYAAGTGVLSGQAKVLPFYMVVASSNSGTAKVTYTPFGADVDGDGVVEFDNNGADAGGMSEYGLWTLQGNTLTYSVAAAVPEAETYAMMLAGLGLVGFMVRRRRNAI